MNHQDRIKNLLFELGASKVGFGYLEDILPTNLKHLKTGISIAYRLNDQILNDIDDKPTHSYFHHYRTVNFKLDQIMLEASSRLQQWGYLAMPIGASQSTNINGEKYRAVFPHKTVATRSGIGWIGKNGCLVTDEYGPRIRLGSILTNMEVKFNEPIIESKCGKCNACVRACPALGLRGEIWYPGIGREEIVDARACSDHMSKYYKAIGRGSVCGICIKVCPRGEKTIRV